MTNGEFELVASAAAAEGSAVAAWVGSIAVCAASSEQAIPVAWREVLQLLVRLRLGLASPAAVVAVPVGLVQRIDLLIGKAGVRVQRS